MIPFLMVVKDLGWCREVIEKFQVYFVGLTIIFLRLKGDCDYPLGFDDPPNYINLRSVGWFQVPVTYTEVKVGIDRLFSAWIP